MTFAERLDTICAFLIRLGLGLVVFLIPIYFAWFQENFSVFDLNKAVLLRLLVGLAAAVWLLRVSVAGQFTARGSRKMMWAMAALAMAYIVSTAISTYPDISFRGTYERQQGLYSLLHYVILFFLIVTTIREPKHIRRLLAWLLAGAAIACVYGFMQAFGFDFLRWAESPQQRIFSTFGQPNFFGHYLAVMLPLTIYAAYYWGRRWPARIAWAVLIGAELVCLVLTSSRAAWIAVGMTAFLFFLWRLWRAHKRVWAGALVILAFAGLTTLALPSGREAVLEQSEQFNVPGIARLASVLDFGIGSNKIRLIYWQAALTDLATSSWKHKLFGYGPDVAGSVYERYYTPESAYYERMNTFPDRAHNTILDLILQFGLLGLAAFLALSWYTMRSLLRVAANGSSEDRPLAQALSAVFVIYFLNNLFSFSLTAMSTVLFALLGLSWTLTGKGDARTVSLGFFQPASRYLISAMLVLLMGITWYGFSLKPLIADVYYMKVKRAEAKLNCREVIDGMEKVLDWHPTSYFYGRVYLYLGVNCFSAASTEESRRALADNLLYQIERLPSGEMPYYTMLEIAHAYSIISHEVDPSYADDAEQYYEKLIELNPWITTVYQDYGRLKLWQENYPEARYWFERGIEITPSLEGAPAGEHTTRIANQIAYFHDLIGLAYYEEKNLDEALRSYEKAVIFNPTLSSSLKKLADIHYLQGDRAAAIRYNEVGYAADSKNDVWPMGLAALYEEAGDSAAALRYAREALDLTPGHKEALRLIERLEKK